MFGKRSGVTVNALGHVRPKKYKRPYDGDEIRTKLSNPEISYSVESQNIEPFLSEDDGFDTAVAENVSSEQNHEDHCQATVSIVEQLKDFAVHHDNLSQNETLASFEVAEEVDDLLNACQENTESDPDGEVNDHNEEEKKEENEEEEDKKEDERIYQGHFLPIKVSVLLIWLYAVHHSITGVQFADLLTLISLHCISPHPALTSLYKFRRFFTTVKSPLVKYHFCHYCLAPCEKTTVTCSNGFCLKDISKSKQYFIIIPIISQLQTFFKRSGFAKLLSSRFSRMKKDRRNIEDIYDGLLYKSLSENNGPLSSQHPYNISFTLNTDGVPIFKSSNVSLWPVYLYINELPYRVRKQKSNMLLCGLWFGNSKPFMPTFTEPLHRELQRLETEGISVEIEGHQENCKAFLLCMTADLPARSTVLNMTQFNGEYSCIKCLEKGENYRTEKGGNIRIFPYQGPHHIFESRTKDSCIRDAQMAFQTRTTVHGFKGLSFLMTLQAFDFVKSVSVDYMHCVLQGITKLLIGLWFGAPSASKPFSLRRYVELVDSRLKEIQPTNTISRMPRSIQEHFKYWKASELRAWLFYYSIPVLIGIMPPLYLYHYASFVEAIYLLCKESISSEDITDASRLLAYFVYKLDTLYGKRYLTLNVHSLLHLPQTVLDIGPLWSHSCFPFENANGDLLKMFHGTQCVDLQIVNAVNVLQHLPMLKDMVPKESLSSNFVNKLLKQFTITEKGMEISTHNFVGKGIKRDITHEDWQKIFNLTHTFPLAGSSCFIYSRATINNHLFHSKEYTRVSVRNSYTIKYEDNTGICHGFVDCFGELNINNEKIAICFVERLQPACQNIVQFVTDGGDQQIQKNLLQLKLSHMHPYCSEGSTDIVLLSSVQSLCVCVKVDDMLFICDEPNLQESNL